MDKVVIKDVQLVEQVTGLHSSWHKVRITSADGEDTETFPREDVLVIPDQNVLVIYRNKFSAFPPSLSGMKKADRVPVGYVPLDRCEFIEVTERTVDVTLSEYEI